MSKSVRNLIIGFLCLLVVVAIIRAATPDERIVYETRTVTKHVTDTKTVTKEVYPQVCLDHAAVVRDLEVAATTMGSIPDEQVNLISEIRMATVRQDNNALVDISERLTELSDKYDGTVDTIVSLRRTEQQLLAECQKALH